MNNEISQIKFDKWNEKFKWRHEFLLKIKQSNLYKNTSNK